MADVRKGDRIVVGRQGLRVFPADQAARQSLFEFMASPVSSEKPKGVTVREIAAAMDCPLNTTLARMHEGLKRLRLLWEQNHA